MIKKSNHEAMATRIAKSGIILGIDDTEETLLWEFFAIYGASTPKPVIDCLISQAKMRPVVVDLLRAKVKISPKWVSPSGLFKRKPHLEDSINIGEDKNIFLLFDSDKFISREISEIKANSFYRWYTSLSAQTINGKTIEVSQDDIDIDIEFDSRDLNQSLRSLIEKNKEGMSSDKTLEVLPSGRAGLIIENNHQHMAKHIAKNSNILGLDNIEEMLLWEFFGIHGVESDLEVLLCLYNLSELNPIIIDEFKITATLDEKWIKPSRLLKRRQRMSMAIDILVEDGLFVIEGETKDDLVAKKTLETKSRALERWQKQIQSIKSNGINSVASEKDIDIHVFLSPINLRDRLKSVLSSFDCLDPLANEAEELVDFNYEQP